MFVCVGYAILILQHNFVAREKKSPRALLDFLIFNINRCAVNVDTKSTDSQTLIVCGSNGTMYLGRVSGGAK